MGDTLPVTESREVRIKEISKKASNIGEPERIASASGGALLCLAGIRKGGLSGLGFIVGGLALLQRGISGHCAAYEQLGLSSTKDTILDHAAVVAITVNAPREKVYAAWRKFEDHSKFFDYVSSVETIDTWTTRWTAEGSGREVSWDSEVIREEIPSICAWRTKGNSSIAHEGTASFRTAPNMRGTEVRVSVDYHISGGAFAKMISQMNGISPRQQLKLAMLNFKRFVETGSLPTIAGQASGRESF